MASSMHATTLSKFDRDTFDRAAMPRTYLESLSRADLLRLAKYFRKMAKTLENPKHRVQEYAWLHAVHELGAIFDVSENRLAITPLEILLHRDIVDVCGYGNGEQSEFMDPSDVIRFLSGDLETFLMSPGSAGIDGLVDLVSQVRQAIIEILRPQPMLWTELQSKVLSHLGMREEFAPFHEAFASLHQGGILEVSTMGEDGPNIDWSTVVRLVEGFY